MDILIKEDDSKIISFFLSYNKKYNFYNKQKNGIVSMDQMVNAVIVLMINLSRMLKNKLNLIKNIFILRLNILASKNF